jgi:hypothetical protein
MHMCDEKISFTGLHTAHLQTGDQCPHTVLMIPSGINNKGTPSTSYDVGVGGFQGTSG